MSERAPYSRVYWSIMEDAKFDGIREDVRHLGSWSILLLVADMAWPAPAYVPSTVPKASFRALVEAGIVDTLSGGRFRIHGLDAERGRRRDAARTGPKRDPNGTQTVGKRDPNGPLDEPSLAEPSKDEPSQADAGTDILDVYYRLTTRFPTSNTADWLEKIGNEFGQDRTAAKLSVVFTADPTPKTLISRLENELRSDVHRDEKATLTREKAALEAYAKSRAITPEQAEANRARLAEITREMLEESA